MTIINTHLQYSYVMGTDFQEMMTIQEVTQYLKISRQYLHKVTKEEKIPSYKLGKNVRYRREDVERYLEEHKR